MLRRLRHVGAKHALKMGVVTSNTRDNVVSYRLFGLRYYRLLLYTRLDLNTHRTSCLPAMLTPIFNILLAQTR